MQGLLTHIIAGRVAYVACPSTNCLIPIVTYPPASLTYCPLLHHVRHHCSTLLLLLLPPQRRPGSFLLAHCSRVTKLSSHFQPHRSFPPVCRPLPALVPDAVVRTFVDRVWRSGAAAGLLRDDDHLACQRGRYCCVPCYYLSSTPMWFRRVYLL